MDNFMKKHVRIYINLAKMLFDATSSKGTFHIINGMQNCIGKVYVPLFCEIKIRFL